MRVWTMSEFFRIAAGIPPQQMSTCVAGDDTFVALSRDKVPYLKAAIARYTTSDTEP